MNRKQRRKVMMKMGKKKYRSLINEMVDRSFKGFEETMRKKWEEDETLNGGDIESVDDWEDEEFE